MHYFLLVSAPLAGLLLDRFAAVKGESASAATLQSGTSSPAPASLLPLFTLLALAALGAPLLGFLQNGAPSGSLAGGLLGFLNLAREALLLTLYIFIFRLAGTSRWFIVLATLAYSLYLAQFPSARLGQALTASGGRGLWIAAEFCLAFGFALSLGAFWVWLHRHPEYAVPPLPPSEPEKELPLSDKAAVPLLEHEAKFRAFCAAFDLSGREMEVLECIVRGLEREVIGLELAISESTVKFHIRRLLKKAAMPDRQRLLHYYTTWKAE